MKLLFKIKYFLALVIVFQVHAATITVNGANVNWLHDWTGATVTEGGFVVPTTGDDAIINLGSTVEVNTALANNPDSLTVADSSSGAATSTLNITAGSLSVENLTIGSGTDTGEVNVSGGTLTLVGDGASNRAISMGSGSTLNLTSGTFQTTGFTAAQQLINLGGTYNISGGTVSILGGQIRNTAGLVVNIDGSDATIDMQRLNLNNSSTFNFTLGSTNGVNGVVSSVDIAGYVNLGNMTINIDGSNFADVINPGDASLVIDLFDTSNVTSVASAVNITGLDGYSYYYEDSSTGNYSRLVIVQTIPEPSALALLAIGISGLMLSRRRNKV